MALLRTEARLHENAAARCDAIMRRLQDTERRIKERQQEEKRKDDNSNREDDDFTGNNLNMIIEDDNDPADFNAPLTRGFTGSTFAGGSNFNAVAFRRSVIGPVETESQKRSKLAKKAANAAIQKELEFVALRRKANSTVSKIMKDTEIAFNKAFQHALQSKNGVECADVVYKICRDIGKYHEERGTNAKGGQNQMVPSEFRNNQPEYLQWLRHQASLLLDDKNDGGNNTNSSEFKDLANHLAKEYNGEAVFAPVKGYKRTVEKVQEKYGGDYSRITDLARGMVVFDTIEQLSGALNYIKSRHDDFAAAVDNAASDAATSDNKEELDKSEHNGKQPRLTLLRAKDRLSPAYDASKFTGGYRDILLNLSFRSGHIAELQLHVTTFLDLKNRRQHRVYEEARSIHMFNEAFTARSYNWHPDADADHIMEEVEELLDEIRSGAVTKLDLDYSEGLWDPENQTKLAEAMLGLECRLQEISLRSCFCGDDFILKCLPLDDEEIWSPENDHGHIGRVIRLGSKLHEGTGGRISEAGVTTMVRYLNLSLRTLDLEGCLDLEWYENCGDSVANALLQLANKMEAENVTLLPQLQELNLKSTGLTPDGMDVLWDLKHRGHLSHAKILTDSKLRTGPPRHHKRTYLSSTVVEH